MRRRGNWMEGFGQRFGRYNSKVKQAVTNRHVLWIHAVSVGEVNLLAPLLKDLVDAMAPHGIQVTWKTSAEARSLPESLV